MQGNAKIAHNTLKGDLLKIIKESKLPDSQSEANTKITRQCTSPDATSVILRINEISRQETQKEIPLEQRTTPSQQIIPPIIDDMYNDQQHHDLSDEIIFQTVKNTFFTPLLPSQFIHNRERWLDRSTSVENQLRIILNIVNDNEREVIHIANKTLHGDDWYAEGRIIGKPDKTTLQNIKKAIVDSYREYMNATDVCQLPSIGEQPPVTIFKDILLKNITETTWFPASPFFETAMNNLAFRLETRCKIQDGGKSFASNMSDFVEQYATALKQLQPKFEKIKNKTDLANAIKWLDQNYKKHIHIADHKFIKSTQFREQRHKAKIIVDMCIAQVYANNQGNKKTSKASKTKTKTSAAAYLCHVIESRYNKTVI